MKYCYIRVQMFYNAVQTEINDWLATQQNIKVIDIKYNNDNVMIVYEIGVI